MRIKRIASAFLSSAMLISACALGVSALEENTTVIFGDINLDNAVSIIDSTELQKYLANMISLDKLTEIDENLLDINNDGAVNIEDATELQKHLADLQANDKIGRKAIWHPAVTKKVWVVDKEAYTYEEPVYETQYRQICNTCGADITGDTTNHMRYHMSNGENYSVSVKSVQVQVGTNTVTVPEEGHWETVVVKEGYWEYK